MTLPAPPSNTSIAPQPAQYAVRAEQLEMTYRSRGVSVQALAPLSFAVPRGQFVSLIGPSGCGKSTLLRLIADIVRPTGGQLWVEGLAPTEARRRRVYSFVFQNPVLLPWRPLLDNVQFGLEVIGLPPSERRARARDLIRLVGLEGFEQAAPHQLSGGMRQRAAIARALTLNPALLLMDEPFGALDEITRERMNFELLRILAQTGATVLFVTHSIDEAVILSDRVLVMTPRPGALSADIDIDLPRPRDPRMRDSDHFIRLCRQVREALYATI